MIMDDRSGSERAREKLEDLAHRAVTDKARGHTKEILGKAKEKIGTMIGDDELKAEGIKQRAEGKKDRVKGEIKEKVEDVKSHVKAGVEVVKEKVDEVRRKF